MLKSKKQLTDISKKTRVTTQSIYSGSRVSRNNHVDNVVLGDGGTDGKKASESTHQTPSDVKKS